VHKGKFTAAFWGEVREAFRYINTVAASRPKAFRRFAPGGGLTRHPPQGAVWYRALPNAILLSASQLLSSRFHLDSLDSIVFGTLRRTQQEQQR